jgi:hypothetical protein
MSKPSSNFGYHPEFLAASKNALSSSVHSGLKATTVDTAGTATVTLNTRQIEGGLLLHTGSTASNVNTPSASDLVGVMGNQVGNSMVYFHRKAGTGNVTYVAGSGVTLVDSPVIVNATVAQILMVVTAVSPAAVSVYRLS